MAESKVATPKPKSRPTVKKTSPAQKPASKPKTAEPNFDLSPEGIRDLLIARPEMIEEGLCVHTGQYGGAPGARFETSVGQIDLLARDAEIGRASCRERV